MFQLSQCFSMQVDCSHMGMQRGSLGSGDKGPSQIVAISWLTALPYWEMTCMRILTLDLALPYSNHCLLPARQIIATESYIVNIITSWLLVYFYDIVLNQISQEQVWYFISKNQPGLRRSDPLKPNSVGTRSSCSLLAFPLSMSLASSCLRCLCFSVSISSRNCGRLLILHNWAAV